MSRCRRSSKQCQQLRYVVKGFGVAAAGKCSVAAPAPVRRVVALPGPDRIQVDVTANGEQLFLVLDLAGVEAVTDQVALAGSAVNGVHAPREGVIDLLHSLRKPAVGQANEEMVMVPKERPVERDPAELLRARGVQLEVQRVLVVVVKQRLAEVAAGGYVVDALRVDRPAPRHAANVAARNHHRRKSHTLYTVPGERVMSHSLHRSRGTGHGP